MEKKKLFIDADGVIFDTCECICNLYNDDFQYYSKFVPVHGKDIKTWDFVELNCTTPEYINYYFNQQRFFDNIVYMLGAKPIVTKLSKEFDVTIVSTGYSPNLRAKETFFAKEFPLAKFIGVNFKNYEDKAHIDMSGGVFIDDSEKNLFTSNADHKVCFGEVLPWNENWYGDRAATWFAVWQMLHMEE